MSRLRVDGGMDGKIAAPEHAPDATDDRDVRRRVPAL
jgi:hypothetical protein